MSRTDRRTPLKLLGTTAAVGDAGIAGAKPNRAGPPAKGRIRRRDLVVTNDRQTGVYVFKITPAPAEGGDPGRGPGGTRP